MTLLACDNSWEMGKLSVFCSSDGYQQEWYYYMMQAVILRFLAVYGWLVS